MGSPVWGAVIVAAGRGIRHGGEVPKQFLDLGGRPVIDWSLALFSSPEEMEELVVVLPPDGSWRSVWTPPDGLQLLLARGGRRRCDSVLSGLSKLRRATHVLVHDAARPLAGENLLRRVMDATVRYGAAVPLVRVPDTIKRVSDEGDVVGTVPRDDLRLSQTPQGCLRERLLEALSTGEEFTDEAAALEASGVEVAVVRGDPRNIKITTREDMDTAGRLVRSHGPGRRTGLGMDFHRFAKDGTLALCGVSFPDIPALEGHSDGDVALHAIADAALSASRLGDVGTLFPPDDPAYRGADSGSLLRRVREVVESSGWRFWSVDLTVVGERPKISEHRDSMIESVGSLLRLRRERVWVKGTTTNSLGDIGRGEGLGAVALVTLERSGS